MELVAELAFFPSGMAFFPSGHFFLLAFFPLAFFPSGIFSVWHFFHLAFFPSGIFSIWHFFHLALFPSDIFFLWHFFPMSFFLWHFSSGIFPLAFLPLSFLPHTVTDSKEASELINNIDLVLSQVSFKVKEWIVSQDIDKVATLLSGGSHWSSKGTGYDLGPTLKCIFLWSAVKRFQESEGIEKRCEFISAWHSTRNSSTFN